MVTKINYTNLHPVTSYNLTSDKCESSHYNTGFAVESDVSSLANDVRKESLFKFLSDGCVTRIVEPHLDVIAAVYYNNIEAI